ncbi:hypothetical protein GGTG_08339 [Gaeumannomyces tritici R3-111a-1]|uniref:Heterokaryon incompatibility domain-containing protein n=1 Tax=Gaeumannomyces tritici (strain R3-111a-1) TaxID=644352 RepID=J3P4A3_GAET3|nr:hypothetical protein GGTG_08339 [Gaeumannomyces tritici R3-111a-1]EJT74499.1 hypothetical protein GGTG_08339 [Gaeumannomyces tritici R3-111a-1]
MPFFSQQPSSTASIELSPLLAQVPVPSQSALFLDSLHEPLAAEPSTSDSSPAPDLSTNHGFYSHHRVLPEEEHIRILYLDSAPMQDGTLAGTIKVISLKASAENPSFPPFAALSYVWAQSACICGACSFGPFTILLNGTLRLNITVNCYMALRQIHAHQAARRLDKIPVWVDSICINQEDQKEKTWQINYLMGKIYMVAAIVYVWLGPGNPWTNAAMDWMRYGGCIRRPLPLARLAKEAGAGIARLGPKARATSSKFWGANILLRLSLVASSFWWWKMRLEIVAGTRMLLDTPWINRIWTFQEILLASSPFVLCGDRILGWDEMMNSVHFTQLSGSLYHHHAYRLPAAVTRYFGGCQLWGAPWRSLMRLWLAFPRLAPTSLGVALRTSGGTRGRPLVDGLGSLPVSESSSDEAYPPRNQSFIERYDRISPGVRPWCSLYWSWLCRLFTLYLVYLPLWPGVWFQSKILNAINENQLSFKLHVAADLLTLLVALIATLLLSALIRNHIVPCLGFILLGVPKESLVRLYLQTSENTGGVRQILAGLQRALRLRVCTQEHDRAFGIWGVLNMLQADPDGVDYSEEVIATHTRLIATMVRWESAAIGLIIDAGKPRSDDPLDGAPSWVPRWVGGNGTHCPSPWLSFRYHFEPWESPAIPILQQQPTRPVIDSRSLRLLGRPHGMVDIVETFSDCLAQQNDGVIQLRREKLLAWISGAWSQIRRSRRGRVPSPTLKALLRHYRYAECSIFAVINGFAISRAPDGRLRVDGTPIPEGNSFDSIMIHAPEEATTIWHRMIKIRDFYPVLGVTTKPDWPEAERVDVDAILSSAKLPESHLDDLVQDIIDDKRCLFTLSNGLIGSGPLDMREGDEIFLLQGVACPMVLRPNGNATEGTQRKYKIVGAALVHGIMHGDYLTRELCMEETEDRPRYGGEEIPVDVEITADGWDEEITIE